MRFLSKKCIRLNNPYGKKLGGGLRVKKLSFFDNWRAMTTIRNFFFFVVAVPVRIAPGVRFSLATGLHVIVAHEKRHLWQARNVRDQAERAARERAPLRG